MTYQRIDTQYNRVLPRDLFNEAKLLKCMGRLCLLIEDRMTPVYMTVGAYGANGKEGFIIGLIDSGELTITNLSILINGKPYLFKTAYNSQANWPLFVEHEDTDYPVFEDNGEWDAEFIQLVNEII